MKGHADTKASTQKYKSFEKRHMWRNKYLQLTNNVKKCAECVCVAVSDLHVRTPK